MWYMAYLTILVVLLGTIGGSLSYEANSALPGDVLYLYKVSVNEQVEKFVANTDEARARWDLLTLTERLQEARTLALHGRLDTKVQTATTNAIQEHVTNMTGVVDRLQQAGSAAEAASIASGLYDLLHTQEHQIADTSSLGSANLQVALAPILVKLRVTAASVALISIKAQAKAHVHMQIADAVISNASQWSIPQ